MNQDTVILDTISSGTSTTVVKQTMDGSPRLFQDIDLYLYNVQSHLYKLSVDTWSEQIPADLSSVLAITSVISGTGTNLVVFGKKSTDDTTYLSEYRVGAGAWTANGALPASFSPVDSTSDSAGNINALTGNQHSGAEARIIAGSATAPYTFTTSDSGMPVDTVTDMDVAE